MTFHDPVPLTVSCETCLFVFQLKSKKISLYPWCASGGMTSCRETPTQKTTITEVRNKNISEMNDVLVIVDRENMTATTTGKYDTNKQ